MNKHTQTTTTLHPFNGLFSRKTWVSRYQKGKTSLDLYEGRDDGVLGRQWHQLDNMQTICTSLRTDNHTNISSLIRTQTREFMKLALFSGITSNWDRPPVPSVLWRCWLGGRKGIRPVKNWVVGCWRGYLSGARYRLVYGPADATATHCLMLQ